MYFFWNLIGEGDEAGIDGCIALIFRICDVVIEVHYLFQQHKNIVSFQLLVVCDEAWLVVIHVGWVIDIQFLVQKRELADLQALFDVLEIGHEGLADHGNDIILETVNHSSIFYIAHLVVHNFHCIDEGLQQVQFEKVGLEIGQKYAQLCRCRTVLVQYLEENAKRGHDGPRHVFLEGRRIVADEGECCELPRRYAADQISYALYTSAKFMGVFGEVAEEDED